MNLRISVVGLIGVAALFVATGSFGASAPPPSTTPTVTIQGAPGNGLIPFTTLNLTMSQLAAMPQTTVTIDGGATTESGPTVLSLLSAAGFTPIAACKNDSLRYWIEAASLTGSAATVTDGEIDPNFGTNTTVLSVKQNGTALTAPRLVVSKDANDARDIPAVYNITIGRAPTVFASTTAACNPPTFTAQTVPDSRQRRRHRRRELAEHLDVRPARLVAVHAGDADRERQRQAEDRDRPDDLRRRLGEQPEPPGRTGPAGYVSATSSEDGAATLLSWGEVDPSLGGAAVNPTCSCKLLSLNENGVTVLKPTGQDTGPRVTAPATTRRGATCSARSSSST